MKQEIKRFNNGHISHKYYVNDRGQKHGLSIGYCYNNTLWWKANWFNGKLYGLDTNYENGKIYEQKYFL